MPSDLSEIQMIIQPPEHANVTNPLADRNGTLQLGLVLITGPMATIVQVAQEMLDKVGRGNCQKLFSRSSAFARRHCPCTAADVPAAQIKTSSGLASRRSSLKTRTSQGRIASRILVPKVCSKGSDFDSTNSSLISAGRRRIFLTASALASRDRPIKTPGFHPARRTSNRRTRPVFSASKNC